MIILRVQLEIYLIALSIFSTTAHRFHNMAPYGSFQDISSVREAMKQTHLSRENQTLKWRLRALDTLHLMIENHKPEICAALQSDLGKLPTDSFISEICLVLNEIQIFRKKLKSWMKPQQVSSPSYAIPMKCEVRSVPLLSPGVLVISPFNYPFLMSLLPVVGALGGGNPVVLKPSEYCKNTAQLLETLIHRYFDEGVMRVIQGGPEVTTDLLKQSWGTVFFTGSERVGKIVAKACAETLTPTILELGGKSPVFVDSTVTHSQLKIMAKRILWGKTLNVGQTCVAPDYVICSESILECLVDCLKEAAKELFGDNVFESEIGRIVTKDHAKRLVKMIDEVESADSKCIVLGGVQECKAEDRFVTPTIVVNPPRDSQMLKEEIFGPILPIISLPNEEEAIQFIQHMPGAPLALYVFTNSQTQYDRIVSSCPSGSAMRNEVCISVSLSPLPFGGIGTSGYGRYKGKFSFDAFTHKLASTSHSSRSMAEWFDLRYPPYKGLKGKVLSLALRYFPDIHPAFYSPRFWLSLVTIPAVIGALFSQQSFCLGLASILDRISEGLKHLDSLGWKDVAPTASLSTA